MSTPMNIKRGKFIWMHSNISITTIMGEDSEIVTLEKELKWLLEEQVHKDLSEIHNTVLECSRRFPFRMGFGDQSVVKSQRNLLSSPNNTGLIKCVVTLAGDNICDADISFKHKSGKDHHIFKTKILPDKHSWTLQQVQDSANHLAQTLSIFSSQDPDHVYKSAREVILLLEELQKFLTLGRTCLAFPKRKSIEELIRNQNMQSFIPPVPNDVALSFYIHSSKLILTVYHLHVTNYQVEILSRHQVDCTVQWLNEAVILFTLAIQQCQQLLDKSARLCYTIQQCQQLLDKVTCYSSRLYNLALQQCQQLLDKLKVLEQQKIT